MNTQLIPAKNIDETDIIVRKSNCPIRLDRTKEVAVYGQKFHVDPRDLIRMIKNITQTIGEYKKSKNPMALYVIHGLRKARSDIAADLESTFNIHFEIDKDTGESIFTI